MWPIPRITNESVTCIFTPQHISISYLVPTSSKTELKDYTRIQYANAELEHAIVCNPTAVKHAIASFITRNNARDAALHFALCGPYIREKITNKSDSIDLADQKQYLYTLENKSFYYTASINQAIIMQYKLLALMQYAHLQTITTPFIAQFALYLAIKGSSFVRTQFAYDLRLYHHRIEALLSDFDCASLMTISKNISFDVAKEHTFLVSSLGLHYLRR